MFDFKNYSESDHLKCFLSRVPSTMNPSTLQTLLEAEFSVKVDEIDFIIDETCEDFNDREGGKYPSSSKAFEETTEAAEASGGVELFTPSAIASRENKKRKDKADDKKLHLGYGYVTFHLREDRDTVLEKGVLRTDRKHNIHIKPVHRNVDDQGRTVKGGALDVCFLWMKNICPYREGCKFKHEGEGGCVPQIAKIAKCFDWVKKGKCKKFDQGVCKHSHEEEDRGVKKTKIITNSSTDNNEDEKKNDDSNAKHSKVVVCRNWKSKGKCKKGDACPFAEGHTLKTKVGAQIKAFTKQDGKVDSQVTTSTTPNDVIATPVIPIPEGCTSFTISNLISSNLRRSTVEEVFKTLGCQKPNKVKVSDNDNNTNTELTVTWKSSKSCEEAFGVLGVKGGRVLEIFGEGSSKAGKVGYCKGTARLG